MNVYTKSKYLADKAAWDFHAELPEAERFELITILPGFIMGPALKVESSVSIDFCRGLITGKLPAIPHGSFPMVDVRDCAQAHLLALKVPEAANRRFLCTYDTLWYKDLAKLV